MPETRIMFIAGEPSGDALGAELLEALRAEAQFQSHPTKSTLRFFGAGGPKLEAAGLRIVWDVQDLPPLEWLQPPDALQVLRQWNP